MSNELYVFIVGTTVYCYLTTTTLAGANMTPSGSVKIGINYKDGTVKIADTTDMTEVSTGVHGYYADTDGWTSGLKSHYVVTVTSIDGSGADAKTVISRGGFRLDS